MTERNDGMVTSTSTADAAQEKCPYCGKEDVYTVFDNVKPEDATMPSVYKLCGDCDKRWAAE